MTNIDEQKSTLDDELKIIELKGDKLNKEENEGVLSINKDTNKEDSSLLQNKGAGLLNKSTQELKRQAKFISQLTPNNKLIGIQL